MLTLSCSISIDAFFFTGVKRKNHARFMFVVIANRLHYVRKTLLQNRLTFLNYELNKHLGKFLNFLFFLIKEMRKSTVYVI